MAQKFFVPVTIQDLSSTGSDAINVFIDNESYARLKLEAGGRLVWGDGTGAGDVNLYRDGANSLKTDDDFTVAGVLKLTASSGSEGGEIQLAAAAANTTLSGPIKVDIFENKKRFFEGGGSNRGAYIDLTATGSTVGTNLLGTSGAMNYAQTAGTKQSNISASGTTIVSVSITTSGYPVQVVVTGDVENNSAGGWTTLQLYRGSTAIGNIVHTEGSAASENAPFALTVIDTPSAGTYTYALKLNSSAGGTFNFGESNGPVITAIELAGRTGATGPAGDISTSSVNDLADVTITSPSNGQVLKYNGTAWVNGTDSTGTTISSIDDIADVTITSATSGDFLKWNGSAWVNDPINLGTDTTGDYVASLVAGTNVSLANNSGEGATPTVTVSGALSSIDSISSPDYVQFDTSVGSPSSTEGKLQWDSDFGTLSFGLEGNNSVQQLGMNQFAYCYNADSVTLTKGTPVYIFGGQGSQVSIKRAFNTSDATSATTLGLVSESIAAGASGYVCTYGVLQGIDTTAYNEGDILYLGATAGTLTATKPSAPNHYVFVGVVIKDDVGGEIWLRPQNGFELDEIHNVSAGSPSSGDFLKYNGTLWVNDAINLGTDTVGDYVSSLVAGTGVTLTNNSGEGATPTVAIGQAVGTTSDVTFNSVTAGGVELGVFSSMITTSSGDLTIAPASLTVNIGNNLVATGTITGSSVLTNSVVFEGATADAYETTLQVVDPTADRTISLPNASGTLAIAGSIALGTDTTGDYVSSLVAGTGISLANNSGEGATPTISSVGARVSDSPPSSPVSGQIWYESDTGKLFVYADSFWVEVGAGGISTQPGLVLVKSQAVGTGVSSVTLTNCFNADYDVYHVVWRGGKGSAAGELQLQLGSSTANYYGFIFYGSYAAATVNGLNDNNTSSFRYVGGLDAYYGSLNVDIVNPYLATVTTIQNVGNFGANSFGMYSGRHAVEASYTDLTITPNAGTLQGGTINVYGYRK